MANTQRGSFRRNGSVLARHRELNPPVRGQSPGLGRLWRVTSDARFLAGYDSPKRDASPNTPGHGPHTTRRS